MNGTAHTEAVPDLAVLSFAVVTERPTASAAAGDNATAAQTVVGEVKAQGIEAKDIRTVSVTLSPVYDETRDGQGRVTKRTLRGYQARNGFEVHMRALDKAGALARQLIEKGANTFGGVRFEIEHPETKIRALQDEAAKDALINAKSYTDALGVKLGRVIEITTNRTGNDNTQFFRFSGGSTFGNETPSASVIPIEPGIQTLTNSVSITWEIAQ